MPGPITAVWSRRSRDPMASMRIPLAGPCGQIEIQHMGRQGRVPGPRPGWAWAWPRTGVVLNAPVAVVETDNVVFAQIGARLNLDQVERYLAGIFQPVDRAQRQIDRLILVHRKLFLIARHER